MAPALRPRFYSISSSSKVHPKAVHVTVGVVRYKTGSGREHRGVCSNFLADATVGQRLRVFVKDMKSSFRLPDPSLPVIMIGPGTGFAPMRGFIQERKVVHAKGETILFFGCRNDADYIYRQELEGYSKDGTLSNLYVAFSRKQTSKVYVQDLIRQQGQQIWDLLESKAHLYICGDAKHMAKDVKQAILEIIKKFGNKNDALAGEYFQQLSFHKRYSEDVWASTI